MQFIYVFKMPLRRVPRMKKSTKDEDDQPITPKIHFPMMTMSHLILDLWMIWTI